MNRRAHVSPRVKAHEDAMRAQAVIHVNAARPPWERDPAVALPPPPPRPAPMPHPVAPTPAEFAAQRDRMVGELHQQGAQFILEQLLPLAHGGRR
jgi:hypothetical protein